MAKAREEFYRGQGVPPGPPTMQGVNGEPDRTGNAYPNAPLGSYDVPKTWPGSPRFAEAGGPPGPPIQWDKRDLTSANAHAGDDYANAPPPPENELYYYHTDHLGSTSYIIDRQGEVMQFACYLPYGEALADEHTVTVTQPYKFSGKELDGETGLYYFGARYYNPKLALWYGVDPLSEKSPSMSGYSSFANNPISVIDPDGRDIIPVHGTWSGVETWGNLKSIQKASNNLFGDKTLGQAFPWSGGNYADSRTKAALGLISHVRKQMNSKTFNGEITLVGHSHGGNVSIEALNMMAEMKEFDNVQLNLLTINTPVRVDYQLSEKAARRVNHVNVYDPRDPVQSRGGNSTVVLPDLPRTSGFVNVNAKGTGEFGFAGRTFKNAKNIQVDNPQGMIQGWKLSTGIIWSDFHNSHNRVNDWIKKTEK